MLEENKQVIDQYLPRLRYKKNCHVKKLRITKSWQLTEDRGVERLKIASQRLVALIGEIDYEQQKCPRTGAHVTINKIRSCFVNDLAEPHVLRRNRWSCALTGGREGRINGLAV